MLALRTNLHDVTRLSRVMQDAPDVELLIDVPWLTVARIDHADGMIQIDVRFNQNADPSEVGLARQLYIPPTALGFVTGIESDPDEFLLQDSTAEIQVTYWIPER